MGAVCLGVFHRSYFKITLIRISHRTRWWRLGGGVGSIQNLQVLLEWASLLSACKQYIVGVVSSQCVGGLSATLYIWVACYRFWSSLFAALATHIASAWLFVIATSNKQIRTPFYLVIVVLQLRRWYNIYEWPFVCECNRWIWRHLCRDLSMKYTCTKNKA